MKILKNIAKEAFFAGCRAGGNDDCDPDADWVHYRDRPSDFLQQMDALETIRLRKREQYRAKKNREDHA